MLWGHKSDLGGEKQNHERKKRSAWSVRSRERKGVKKKGGGETKAEEDLMIRRSRERRLRERRLRKRKAEGNRGIRQSIKSNPCQPHQSQE